MAATTTPRDTRETRRRDPGTVTSKVENELGGNFQAAETWTWKITDEEEATETEPAFAE